MRGKMVIRAGKKNLFQKVVIAANPKAMKMACKAFIFF